MHEEEENCGNPDCPYHGQSEDAKSIRAARQAIVTNEHLMSVLRVIVGNINDNMSQQIGDPIGMLMSVQYIKGERDNDPIMEGAVRGLAVMVKEKYPPVMSLLEGCVADEGPNVVERIVEEEKKNPRPAPSVQDFLAMLKGIMGER